jgi:hypothetical protein
MTGDQAFDYVYAGYTTSLFIATEHGVAKERLVNALLRDCEPF